MLSNVKKIATLLTAGFVTLVSFASCSGSGKTDAAETTAPVSESQAEESILYKADYLPDKKYNGYQYRIVGYEEYPADFDTETGNMVNDAIFRRNRLVEETYDIDITETQYPFARYEDVNALMQKNSLAMADDYDLYTLVFRHAFGGVLSGYIPPASYYPVADFSQPWYIQATNDYMVVDGVQVVAYTSFDRNPGGRSILFNKRLINDLNLELPYNLVDNNSWTYDAMLEMAKAAISDLDSDGVMTEADRYGFISEIDDMTELMYGGSGMKLVDFSSGMPELSNYEQLYTMFELYSKYMSMDGFLYNTFAAYGYDETSRTKGVQMFKSGGSLFMQKGTNVLTTLGDMKDDYDIVPFPKWKPEQKSYYVAPDGSRIAVPLSCSADLELVCVIKEALAVESLNFVYPAYYEFALKNRYVRDEDSIRMLEIITQSVTWDLGSSLWSDIVRQPWMNALDKKSTDVMSAIEANRKNAESQFAKLMEQIAELKIKYQL